MAKFVVTLNYKANYGYVEYVEAASSARGVLPVAEKQLAVEEYLAERQTFQVPADTGVCNFVTRTLEPLASLENFKLCLTRLWVKTEVRVEWSMPPGMAGNIAFGEL